MKDKQNKIFNKYIDLLVFVAKYTNARGSIKITTTDMLVCLLDLFSKNLVIRDFLLKFGLDVSGMLNILSNGYNLSSNNVIKTGLYKFILSNDVVSILEKLSDIGKADMFVLSLFFELLYEKNNLAILTKGGYGNLLSVVNLQDILLQVSKNPKIQVVLSSLFNLNDMFSPVLMEDNYSDFDYDDVDEDVTETDEKLQDSQDKKGKLLIDTFGINLVEEAKKGNLEPVVGRENELNQIMYTLLRKTKSNPLLIGEAGVGKTAIVEGLAQRIANGTVPAKLKNKKIYNLDIGSLIAGTKFRGEFEARLKSIIQEVIDPENNIILFIDEIHTVVGAGNQEGGADTANLLKPYLARGEINLIGATTFNEYRKYIEKDPALTRRFQIVKIEEPSEEEAIKLLQGIKYRFEDFHGVNITNEAIQKAVRLSKRYILDKYLPDKAIDLVDEACSRKSSKVISKEKEKKIETIQKKIEKLEQKIQKAVKVQDYFTAADYKEKIMEYKRQITKLQSADDTPKELRVDVKGEDIEKVIAEKYGISSSVLSKSEFEFLVDLKSLLNKEIIGQEHAVEEVVNAIIRNKLSPVERSTPIGSFLFLGPSGVGKTFLAKLLAKHFFQDENALISINMSEYSQGMSANKLTGSAPGYVGYEEGGVLTEAVRKKPYSVVLFDEIEKGSSEVMNILLHILDNGYLQDNKGRKIDFKNTIIILTSNIGLEHFNKQISKVGFTPFEEKKDSISEEKKEIILNEVKEILPAELVNRFDKVVFFNPMNEQLLKKIFDKYYKDYRRLWKEKKGINIPTLRKDTIDELIKKIHKEGAGVRGIEKYLYNEFENKVIQSVVNGKIKLIK